MTTLEDIKELIAPELKALDRTIRGSLSSSNALMNRVVENYLQKKGKLIRPIMVILTSKLLGEDNEKIIPSAAAVEMLHNASLIHDDVVDDSKQRRGAPTINSIWDNHIAVLVGDFFVSSALRQALSTGDLRITEALAKLGQLLSLGELDQIYNARNRYITEEAYFQVISRKTASLFVSCVEMGSYAVGVDDRRLETMRKFAEQLGLCFQIRDDIFDYYPDQQSTIGKPTGNDLREGKITLPLIYALTSDSITSPELLERRKEMLTLIDNDYLSDSQINELYQFAIDAGGIEYAYKTMENLHTRGLETISEFGDHPAANAMRSIFDYIITRCN